MKNNIIYFFVFFFLTFPLQAQSDTIRYYFDREAFIKHYESSFSAFSERIKREAKKNVRTYPIPLYCFNSNIEHYYCGDNLETMIDFTQRPDLQTTFVVKGRNNIIFYKLFFDRFYEEIEEGHIKANKEIYNRKYRFYTEERVNRSDGKNFYLLGPLIGMGKKPTFFQKIGKGIKQITTRKRFQYGKLWRFMDRHPDAHVFQITFVPGYWAIKNEKLIRISDGKKVKISDANRYFCESYPYCAVRLIYGKDSTYSAEQEECDRQKYPFPLQKCNDCKKLDFKKIILINDNK